MKNMPSIAKKHLHPCLYVFEYYGRYTICKPQINYAMGGKRLHMLPS